MYIVKETTTYPSSILSNYYKIELDLSTNSIFQALGTSNYAYLYYQYYIIRTNIHTFINEKAMYSYLMITTENEFQFNDGEKFCIYSTWYYVLNYYDTTDLNFVLEKMSDIVRDCRKNGNGLNLSYI